MNWGFRRNKQKFELWDSYDTVPAKIFNTISTGGDIRNLVKHGDKESVDIDLLNKTWESIYNDHLSVTGFNKNYVRIMNQEDKVAKLRCSIWIKGRHHMMHHLSIEEKKLANMKNNFKTKERQTFERSVGILQKSMGLGFDPNTTSAAMYHVYIALHEEEHEKAKMDKVKKKLNIGKK